MDGRRRALELFALCGLAIAQPLYDTFGRAPDVFLAHGADRADLVLFAVLVLLVPPVVLWLVEVAVTAIDDRAGRLLHTVLVVGLASLAVLQFLKLTMDLTGRRLALAVAVAAVAIALVYLRVAVVRRWLAVMAAAPLLFFGVFVVASPAADALDPEDVEAATGVEGNGTSVVMVIADELPMQALLDGDGAVDAELFPSLARLAGEGTWYRNTGTAATVTAVALPALLTGQDPENGLAPTAADHPENLFTLLGGSYDLEAIETTTSLCPRRLCDGPLVDADPTAATVARDDGLGGLLDDAATTLRDLASFDPFVGPRPVPLEVVEAPVEEGPAAPADLASPGFELADVRDFVASIEADEGPTVHLLHVQLPHAPYVFTPDGRVYQDRTSAASTLEIAGRRSPVPYETALARQRLALQTSYVDGIVGQVLDRLDETGVADRAAVVVTSDHGVGLQPGEEKRPLTATEPVAEAVYPDLLQVPLLVRAPGLAAGAVDDRNAATIDVLPTIAELVDVEVPWAVDGRSLLGPPRPDDERTFVQVLPRDAAGDIGFEIDGTRGPAAIGPPVTYDGAETFERALARNLDADLFGGATGPHRAYHLVPSGDLVGRPVDELEIGAGAAGRVELEPSDEAFAPLRVRGRVVGADEGPLTVAVAVDGMVAAVVPTFASEGDDHRLDLMLDHTVATASAPGELRFYAVESELAPLASG